MKIRKANRTDRVYIANIYNQVAGKVEGITRRPEEITETYVFSLLNMPEDRCIFLIVENDKGKIIGFGHAEKNGLKAYDHILSNYAIVIAPEGQHNGIGKSLFIGFLEYLKSNRPDIKRLEMEVKDDPERVIKFEAAGFKTEAIIKSRARSVDGTFYDQVLMAWENPNFKG